MRLGFRARLRGRVPNPWVIVKEGRDGRQSNGTI